MREKNNFIVLTLTLVCISIFTLNCKNKNTVQSWNNIKKDSAIINLGESLHAIISHGSTNITLDYDGPNNLNSVECTKSDSLKFGFSLGPSDFKYPSMYSVSSSKNHYNGSNYYFYENTGNIASINIIGMQKHRYYKFDETGNLLVSGYYNENDPCGVWIHYDNAGIPIEKINVDTLKEDIFLKFHLVNSN